MPLTAHVDRIDLTFPRAPVSVARARAGLRPLRDALGDRYEDAVLLVSELATNAVRHGAGTTFRLEARVEEGRCRVEVIDGGSGFQPPAYIADPELVGGRGLPIVASLAHRWGVFEGSTHVWFELRV